MKLQSFSSFCTKKPISGHLLVSRRRRRRKNTMGIPGGGGRGASPWVMCSFFFVLFISGRVPAVEASHPIFRQLQSIPASVVSHKSRTAYHFQPPKHWINDPNGPMYYNGVYHLFYQYNPKGSVWGNIVWAHSVSRDLVNWVPLEAAIFPSIPSDINGTWSGSATILPDGRPAILYTGIDAAGRQLQNLAFPANLSDPFLRHWVKPAAAANGAEVNPVISPDADVNATAFRDPTTAWLGADGEWRVAVGSKWGEEGRTMLYKSKDFLRWSKAASPLHSSPGTGMLECPDFYPVATNGTHGLDTSAASMATSGGNSGVKHVLKASLDETRFEYYTIGEYVQKPEDKYVPDGSSPDNRTGLRYDYGNFYASKTFYDGKHGRRILWGWSNESDTKYDDMAKGWAGIQTIPRKVWLDDGGKQLVQWPVEELEELRGSKLEMHDQKLAAGSITEVDGVKSAAQADVEVEFGVSGLDKAEEFDEAWRADPQALCAAKPASAKGGVGPFGLYVLASRKMEEKTAVFFRVFKASSGKHVVLMCQDPTKSTLSPGMWTPTFAGFVDVDIKKTKKISLRSLIDHSVVESFGAGGKTCITTRVYPSLALGKKARLFVFNNGEQEVKVTHLTAWEMNKAQLH